MCIYSILRVLGLSVILYIFLFSYIDRLLFHLMQGEEICVALQTHINDVMLRRYSKARSAAGGSMNGDSSSNVKPPSVEVYEKRIQDLSKALEESQNNCIQVSRFDYYQVKCFFPIKKNSKYS